MLLHQEFVKIAKKYSHKTAIKDRTTGNEVSYGRALIGALILSKKIKKYKESYVGIMIPTSAGCILSIIGTIMAGKVPVMINYSTGAAENCEYAKKKCGFKTIITSRALLEKIGCRVIPGMVFIEDIMKSVTTKEKISAALKSKLPTAMVLNSIYKGELDDNIVILFTSGSEKDPKAVQLTHRNLSSNIKDIFTVLEFTDDDIVLANLPLFHVFGYNVNCWLPMLRGLTTITYANPLDYNKIVDIIKNDKITIMVGTPIFFTGYLRRSQPGDFKSIRLAIAGADKTPDILRQGYKEKHDINLLEGYGCTETSPVVTLNTEEANKPGSIGKPFPSVTVKIANIDSLQELPRGEIGKILVKGDLVMKGYFDDLEETSYRIKDGWYDTGDMGMMDEDGFVWHKGRLKRFVKIGGEMVSLVRTESVLTEILPDDIDCCVVEVPDFLKGAKIVAAITKPIEERAVLKKMAQELPNIALPKEFMVIKELPKMGSGKINFREVTEMVKEKDHQIKDNKKKNKSKS